MARIRPWLAVLLLVIGCSGCIVVPIAQQGRHVTSDWRERMRELEKARPTRAETVGKLGQPAYSFSDLPVLGYQWSGVEWDTFWMFGTQMGYAAPEVARLLWIGFDASGRMSEWEVTSRSPRRTIQEQAFDWSVARGLPTPPAPSPGFTAKPAPEDQAVVHVFWDAFTEEPPAVWVRVDGRERVRIAPRRFTTIQVAPGTHQFGVGLLQLDLQLAAGQVRYLEFHPAGKGSGQPATLVERREPEALVVLKSLSYGH